MVEDTAESVPLVVAAIWLASNGAPDSVAGAKLMIVYYCDKKKDYCMFAKVYDINNLLRSLLQRRVKLVCFSRFTIYSRRTSQIRFIHSSFIQIKQE